MLSRLFAGWMLLAFMTLALSSIGCKYDDKKQAKNTDDKKNEISKADAKHDGWWCQEHGVPEHMCSQCSAEVAAKLKKEGDWCKEHDRAESQCFLCNAARYKKFEDMYVAKYGTKAERPPESEFKK
jgi:hypothetical protein